MKTKHWILLFIILVLFIGGGIKLFKKVNINTNYEVGQAIDSLYGVKVYYNGGVDHVEGRNVTADGYNLGLKYQCVEFVKRFYYEHYKHKMPDTYGHAKSFFDPSIPDGVLNPQRNLVQFTNGSKSKPQVGDLIVYGPSVANSFGHVAIVSAVFDKSIEIIQQNAGACTPTRVEIKLENENGKFTLKKKRIYGWLRKN